MRLKSLELHGFKSFPDKTKISFDKGVTVIVGPNGSGKSNISDAVRWVLGEISSKNIRGNKMEDVIFGGTDSRSSMGFAEVSLTIENTGEHRVDVDYDEITVTRRYYRSGDSEYMINQKPVRLRDINEMFMNTGIGKTGYSIIGQGRVSEIISQKSEDRRAIFEEAAGISKFRAKKQEAERKLEATNENLVRLNDILGELEVRVSPLEKDAAKARIYLDLYNKKKEIDVSLALFDIDNIVNSGEQTEKAYQLSKQTLDIATELLESFEAQSERLYASRSQSRLDYEEAVRNRSEATEKKHAIEATLLVGRNELLHIEASNEEYNDLIKENKDAIEKTLSDAAKNKALIKEKEDLLFEKNESFESSVDKLEKTRAAHAELGRQIDIVNEKKEELGNEKNELMLALSALASTKTATKERYAEIEQEFAQLCGEMEQTRKKIASSEKTLTGYESELAKSDGARAESVGEMERAEKEKEELLARYNRTLSEISAKTQRAETLKRMDEHFEGYQSSVRAVLKASASGTLSGICGPVSSLISLEGKYSVAIETALGAGLQNIVCEDEDSAKRAIDFLKRENAGRATFYPLTSVKFNPLSINMNAAKASSGFVGIANSLVRTDAKYENVIAYLLGRTLVFNNLDNAIRYAKSVGYSVRIVTLDGQIINAGGSFTGGSSKTDSGILTRKNQIEIILAEKAVLEDELAKINGLTKELDERLKEAKKERDSLSDKYMILSSLHKSEQSTLELQRTRLAEQNSKLSALNDAKDQMDKRDGEADKKATELEDSIIRKDEALAKADSDALSIKEALDASYAEIERLVSEKNELFVVCSVLKKEIENAKNADAELESLIASLNAEKQDIGSKMEAKRSKHKELSEKIKTDTQTLSLLDARIDELKKLCDKLSGDDLEFERRQNELRNTIKEKTHERELAFNSFTKLESKRAQILSEKDKITEKLWEDYELTYAAATELPHSEVSAETRQSFVSSQNKLRAKIRELGPVNVNAIEEYAEVSQRYEFLSTQLKDLNKSKDEFTEIISKLDSEMCTRFSETFVQVNENFKQVFSELFGGGSANLSLVDPDNVLQSGIEISVAPPGKIIKSLKLLSGGEQVFVAIAILFAILKVNPAPFCLFDEIESALDEVNVDRFAEYVKQYSDGVQFVIITHRRGSMEISDTLYGVTMPQRGVSRVLSVNVNEVEAKTGLKAN